MFLRISGRSSAICTVSRHSGRIGYRQGPTIEKAVLALRFALPLVTPLLSWPLGARATLALVVLGELPRKNLVLLELTAGLGARWLRWRRFFCLEVGIRHAWGCQYASRSGASLGGQHTQQCVEGRLNFASTGNQHGLDDIAVDGGEGLNQRVLCLDLGVDRPGGLLGRNLGCLFVEAHARLGRLGGRRR